MRTVYLDALQMEEKERAHRYLQEQLALPDYYGRNLDALSDCLEEMRNMQIVLEHSEEAGDYFPAVLAVMEDAAKGKDGVNLRLDGGGNK